MKNGWTPAKQTYTHRAMAEYIIANPSTNNIEIANEFGRTPEWVRLVRSSDMFRELLIERSAELVDPLLIQTVEDRVNSLASRSLEVLMDKLSAPSEEIPAELALQAATLGAKMKGIGGFGAKQAPPPVIVSPDRLERLAENLRALNRPQPIQEITDVEVKVPIPRQTGPSGEPSV